MILKKYLLTEFREKLKKKKKILRKAITFFGVGPVLVGWVGARQTNIFLRSA